MNLAQLLAGGQLAVLAKLDALTVSADAVAELAGNPLCVCGHRHREHLADGVFGCASRGCACVGFDPPPA